MRRLRLNRGRLPVMLLGLAFFFAPLVAFVAGERAKPIENRPLVDLPSASRGFAAFDDLTQWSVDHLPLRASAVRLDSNWSEELFGEAPLTGQARGPVGLGPTGRLAGRTASGPRSRRGFQRNRVVVGDNGWLYLGDSFVTACRPLRTSAEVISQIRRLSSIVRRSGRRFLFALPPDKASLVPEHVPDDYALKNCAERAHARHLAALRAAAIPGYVDLERPLEREQARRGVPIYLRRDTHWTDAGAVVMARALADALDSRLRRCTTVTRGRDRREAEDLAFQLGDSGKVTQTRLEVRRCGVHDLKRRQGSPYRSGHTLELTARSGPGGARLVPGTTLIHGDSFTERSLDQLAPFYSHLSFFPVLTSDSPKLLPEGLGRLIESIKASRTVIFLKAERGFWSREPGSILETGFLNSLDTALSKQPRADAL